jgi:hypothetical protein
VDLPLATGSGGDLDAPARRRLARSWRSNRTASPARPLVGGETSSVRCTPLGARTSRGGGSIERAAAVEHAFRTLELVMAHRASLVILGEFDLVPHRFIDGIWCATGASGRGAYVRQCARSARSQEVRRCAIQRATLSSCAGAGDADAGD